jgi:Tfp pilus assembly protein PilF
MTPPSPSRISIWPSCSRINTITAANAAYEATLRADPTFRDAHGNVAQLYEQLGRRRDALRHYAAATRLKD